MTLKMTPKYSPKSDSIIMTHIQKCTLVYDQQQKESRGFGLVTFEDIEDAVDAKKDCTGLDLHGHQ